MFRPYCNKKREEFTLELLPFFSLKSIIGFYQTLQIV
jgi:hypothetical protein